MNLKRKQKVNTVITTEQINELNNRLFKARNLLLSEAIDVEDYRLIKAENEEQTRKLEAQLNSTGADNFDVDKIIDDALKSFTCLDQLYLNSEIAHKREIISSIFPEN